MGSLMCTATLVCASHKKARQVLTSLPKCSLNRSEIWSFTVACTAHSPLKNISTGTLCTHNYVLYTVSLFRRHTKNKHIFFQVDNNMQYTVSFEQILSYCYSLTVNINSETTGNHAYLHMNACVDVHTHTHRSYTYTQMHTEIHTHTHMHTHAQKKNKKKVPIQNC